MSKFFFVEITDTFGGEANYCWVHRFKVSASSFRGAVTKIAKETGIRFRIDCNHGDMARYNAHNTAACAFVYDYDEDACVNYSMKTI